MAASEESGVFLVENYKLSSEQNVYVLIGREAGTQAWEHIRAPVSTSDDSTPAAKAAEAFARNTCDCGRKAFSASENCKSSTASNWIKPHLHIMRNCCQHEGGRYSFAVCIANDTNDAPRTSYRAAYNPVDSSGGCIVKDIVTCFNNGGLHSRYDKLAAVDISLLLVQDGRVPVLSCITGAQYTAATISKDSIDMLKLHQVYNHLGTSALQPVKMPSATVAAAAGRNASATGLPSPTAGQPLNAASRSFQPSGELPSAPTHAPTPNANLSGSGFSSTLKLSAHASSFQPGAKPPQPARTTSGPGTGTGWFQAGSGTSTAGVSTGGAAYPPSREPSGNLQQPSAVDPNSNEYYKNIAEDPYIAPVYEELSNIYDEVVRGGWQEATVRLASLMDALGTAASDPDSYEFLNEMVSQLVEERKAQWRQK